MNMLNKLLFTGVFLASITLGNVMASPIQDLQKVGSAKLEVFFFDIYYSELFSEDGQYQPGTYPLALQIKYLRDIKAKDLIERTDKEWKKLGYTDEQTNSWLHRLEEIWPDIKEDDMLTLRVEEGGTSVFYFNNDPIGEMDDDNFGKSFLAIWLDEDCSYPKLRKKLIGG